MHTGELGDVEMQLMPVPQPPLPISARGNQPTWRVVCANLSINEAEESTAGDDLGMGVVDEVAARPEACCTEAFGAGCQGEDSGVQWILRRGEQEGGEDSGLTPLRLALLGEGTVLAEGGRGGGLGPQDAVSRLRRGGVEHLGVTRTPVQRLQPTEFNEQ